MLTHLASMSSNVRYIGKTDSITISVWNHKKIHKKQGAGFLGCVRLLSNAINRLIDTGCKCARAALCFYESFLYHFFPPQDARGWRNQINRKKTDIEFLLSL